MSSALTGHAYTALNACGGTQLHRTANIWVRVGRRDGHEIHLRLLNGGLRRCPGSVRMLVDPFTFTVQVISFDDFKYFGRLLRIDPCPLVDCRRYLLGCDVLGALDEQRTPPS